MLDLDCRVVAEIWKFAVHVPDDRERVRCSVEKVRITEADVLCARGNLPANIFQNNFALHDAECSVIHRNNRTMTAQMFAAATRFRISNDAISTIRHNQMRAFCERGKSRTLRHAEFLSVQRNLWPA